VPAVVASGRRWLPRGWVQRCSWSNGPPTLGGNAARSGVNCWERGAGGTGLPFDIYRRLKKIPGAVGIYAPGRHLGHPAPGEPVFPGGENRLDPARRYLDSLRCFGAGSYRNHAITRELWHGVPFEPEAYAQVVGALLAETNRVTIWTHTAFTRADTEGRRVTVVHFADGRSVRARTVIDATADINVAHAVGCATVTGQESRQVYGEPHAPPEGNDRINATTLIYRVAPKPVPAIDPLPPTIPANCWWTGKFPVAAVTEYPNGDRNINMLPTMEGRETQRLGRDAAYAECRRRELAHWHDLQASFDEFQSYRLVWIAPELGVRETRRLVGRYVLTEHDLDAGLRRQQHADIICIADHTKDTHGEGQHDGNHGELEWPYGVPYRCLLPQEFDNLAVACRGASFSSIGASSCRLSRTMMQLGQAAGTAAALAVRQDLQVSTVQPAVLRESLVAQHVQLDWPMPATLQRHLQAEDE
jgi:hypothetical protein